METVNSLSDDGLVTPKSVRRHTFDPFLENNEGEKSEVLLLACIVLPLVLVVVVQPDPRLRLLMNRGYGWYTHCTCMRELQKIYELSYSLPFARRPDWAPSGSASYPTSARLSGPRDILRPSSLESPSANVRYQCSVLSCFCYTKSHAHSTSTADC